MAKLAIGTADNAVITADTIFFTGDGANLANGGTSVIVEDVPGERGNFNELSYTVTAQIAVTPYGISGVNAPYPILYPPQTFYVGGKAITV